LFIARRLLLICIFIIAHLSIFIAQINTCQFKYFQDKKTHCMFFITQEVIIAFQSKFYTRIFLKNVTFYLRMFFIIQEVIFAFQSKCYTRIFMENVTFVCALFEEKRFYNFLFAREQKKKVDD